MQKSSDKINILMVDDRYENLISLAAILDNPTYNLVKAESGREALKHLLEQDFALILLDVQMPVIDGFETAMLIKQRERSKSTPIIFVTAISRDEPFAFKGYDTGAVDYIVKPFEPHVLRSKVAVFADLWSKTQQLKHQNEILRINERLESEKLQARRELVILRREHVAHERYRDLLEGIENGIVWTADPETLRFTFVSAQAERISGFKPDYWTSKKVSLLSHLSPTDIELIRTLRQLRDTPRPFVRFEHLVEGFDGKKVWLQTGVRLAEREDGQGFELRGLSVDITHLKQIQGEAQKAVQLRDEFLSIASHELKTPLTPLKLQIDSLRRLLRSGADAEKVQERLPAALDMASRQVDRMGRLVEELLDVARINNGKLVIEREPMDFNEMVRDICERFEQQLKQAQCELVVEVEGDGMGEWDRLRVEQIFINLLSNAVKYAPGGQIEVRLRSTDESVELRVRDRGMGIEEKDQKRIFSVYERGVSASNFGGLGLGLYIVQQIVLAHGGTIGVQSRPGEGAEFTVKLPRNIPAAGLARPNPSLVEQDLARA